MSAALLSVRVGSACTVNSHSLGSVQLGPVRFGSARLGLQCEWALRFLLRYLYTLFCQVVLPSKRIVTWPDKREPEMIQWLFCLARGHFAWQSVAWHVLPDRMNVRRDILLRSGHTERGLPQRTAVSVRCGMLHSKQTLLTIIFWKHSS